MSSETNNAGRRALGRRALHKGQREDLVRYDAMKDAVEQMLANKRSRDELWGYENGRVALKLML